MLILGEKKRTVLSINSTFFVARNDENIQLILEFKNSFEKYHLVVPKNP